MTDQFIKIILNITALCSMLAGLFGMLFCFPFLWSTRMEALVSAGFPFIAGSILFGSGLLTLGIINRNKC
jgi:hypothetical protein